MGRGEGPTLGRVPSMLAAFSKCSQNRKNAIAQGSAMFRDVSNSFWEGVRKEKTCHKKVSYLLAYIYS